jgi:hypothetical protein
MAEAINEGKALREQDSEEETAAEEAPAATGDISDAEKEALLAEAKAEAEAEEKKEEKSE